MNALLQHISSRISGIRPLQGRVLLLAVAGMLTLGVSLLFGGALRSVEEQLGALAWRLDPLVTPEERINIIAIDEKSLAARGPMPWPRDTMAQLGAALTEAGVQLQLYDVVFPEARDGDAAFVDMLAGTGGVLAQVPALQSDQQVRTGLLSHPLTGISCTAQTNTATSYIANAPAFDGIAKGHITPLLGNDGAVRKVPAFICVDGQAYPALALSALLVATRADSWGATLREGSGLFGPEQMLMLDAWPGLEIPLDADGNLRVSFRSAPEAFTAFSAVDVIEGRIDPAWLDNTWALIGHTAFGLVDIVPTPYNGAAPGVELQARLLASVIDSRVPYTPRTAPWLLLLEAALFAALLFVYTARARERIGAIGLVAGGVLLPLLAYTLHVQLLLGANLWLGWLLPAIYGFSAATLLLLHEYARVRLERSRVLGNLSSYLPSDVAHEIAYTLPRSSIEARRQDATLLSADLRNFSAYGESRPPEESAALLHYFFVRTTALIEAEGGRVHEFKGDSLLAIWDGSGSNAANRALRAAQAMQQAMQDILPQTPPPGLEPLALGIGIEQGPVLVGSIGPAHRRTHTLLGETVTITLRIQTMTAELAQPILLGECAARQLSDAQLESQGSYLLDGLRIPHTLFAPPLAEPPLRKSRSGAPLKVVQGGRS